MRLPRFDFGRNRDDLVRRGGVSAGSQPSTGRSPIVLARSLCSGAARRVDGAGKRRAGEKSRHPRLRAPGRLEPGGGRRGLGCGGLGLRYDWRAQRGREPAPAPRCGHPVGLAQIGLARDEPVEGDLLDIHGMVSFLGFRVSAQRCAAPLPVGETGGSKRQGRRPWAHGRSIFGQNLRLSLCTTDRPANS